MTNRYTQEGMEKRVMRFAELRKRGEPITFIDSIIPGHYRMNYSVIGDTASENPDLNASQAIEEPHKFQIGMGWAPPGCGPHWHTHDYVEMFFILEGQWRFFWGYDEDPENPEGEFLLDKWDAISLPPRVWRRFEVAGESTGWFLAVLDPHEVFRSKDPHWPPAVVKHAESYGFHADETGKMVRPDNYDDVHRQHNHYLQTLFQELNGVALEHYKP